jgi:hypothetical protein
MKIKELSVLQKTHGHWVENNRTPPDTYIIISGYMHNNIPHVDPSNES